MKYKVLLDGKYMQSFSSFTEASEFADDLQSRFHGHIVEIVTY